MIQLDRSDLCASTQQMVTERNSEMKIKNLSDLSKSLARRNNSIPRLSLLLLKNVPTAQVSHLRSPNPSLNIDPVPKVFLFIPQASPNIPCLVKQPSGCKDPTVFFPNLPISCLAAHPFCHENIGTFTLL